MRIILKKGFFENSPLFNMVWKEEYFCISLDHSVGILTIRVATSKNCTFLNSDDEAFNIKFWPFYFLSLAFIFIFISFSERVSLLFARPWRSLKQWSPRFIGTHWLSPPCLGTFIRNLQAVLY